MRHSTRVAQPFSFHFIGFWFHFFIALDHPPPEITDPGGIPAENLDDWGDDGEDVVSEWMNAADANAVDEVEVWGDELDFGGGEFVVEPAPTQAVVAAVETPVIPEFSWEQEEARVLAEMEANAGNEPPPAEPGALPLSVLLPWRAWGGVGVCACRLAPPPLSALLIVFPI